MRNPSLCPSATTTNSKFLKELQAILNMGNRLRFPVMWKALKICQGVDIEPSVVSDWLPAGDGEDPRRYMLDSSAADRFHCS